MKLNAASDFFKSLILKTDNKPEIKVYESFIGIISNLESRDFKEEELQGIEDNLDMLKLTSDPDDRKAYYRKSLNTFKKYLKDELSLITEGYYTAIGIALGVAFGVAFGAAFGMGIGLVLGMVIGLAIGASKDSDATKQNRVLKTKLS